MVELLSVNDIHCPQATTHLYTEWGQCLHSHFFTQSECHIRKQFAIIHSFHELIKQNECLIIPSGRMSTCAENQMAMVDSQIVGTRRHWQLWAFVNICEVVVAIAPFQRELRQMIPRSQQTLQETLQACVSLPLEDLRSIRPNHI